MTFTNHGSYNTFFGIDPPTVTFSCSATGCVQNTKATGTVVTSNSTATCGAAQGSYDVCIVSVTITNAGSYTLTGGSIVMTVGGYYSQDHGSGIHREHHYHHFVEFAHADQRR